MSIYEVAQAISAANDTLRQADDVATQLAGMLKGRLRHVSRYTLVQLKRELRDFNSNTKRWKEEA